ncbi:hypothetical protein CYMTET_29739 [Cymbomonas tetramitiformis]|uniref:Secreted protein n=1 Tax=Cymbomonas tetramitiformis TaxID=36881 RepID=A0AAE0FK61_9CHLO|nr:hypothetical protein CYMTET_29739 [Cymbomonas tetramitiformis]
MYIQIISLFGLYASLCGAGACVSRSTDDLDEPLLGTSRSTSRGFKLKQPTIMIRCICSRAERWHVAGEIAAELRSDMWLVRLQQS